MKSEKQSLTVFINPEDEEPQAILYFNKNRDRIIYTIKKADDEEIINILENKHVKIKT